MKLLCDACHRLLPPASWKVDDDALHLTCAGCGHTSVQSVTGPTTETRETSPRPERDRSAAMDARGSTGMQSVTISTTDTRDTSPQPPRERSAPVGARPLAGSGAVRPSSRTEARDDGETRASRENMPGVASPFGLRGQGPAEAAHDPQAHPVPTWLDEEWARLTSRWNDPEAHKKLLAQADARDDLPSLGRRYKEHLDADPNDVVAQRARDELIKRASAHLLVATPRKPARTSAKNVIAATVLLTVAGLLVVLLLQLVRGAGAP